MKLEINHVLIRTDDFAVMIRFFEQVLELKNCKRPSFAFAGAWLWADEVPLIHLSEANPVDKGQLDYLGNNKYPINQELELSTTLLLVAENIAS